ncbi:MAG: hypothetical protein JWM41_1283 [Gemmatimonadetes bacterium]|nr:hypothetical protein [Gemmatimonadota bacterium]
MTDMSPLSRRYACTVALMSFVVATTMACAGRSGLHTQTDSKCKDPHDAGVQPVELKQTVKELQNKEPGCIKEIADLQALDASTTTSQEVPAAIGCAAGDSTSVEVTQYSSGGTIGAGMYGDGSGKHRGYVLARIKNTGPCTTAAPFNIPAGADLLWIVDHKKNGKTKSYLVDYTTEQDLNNSHKYWNFGSCGHTGNTGDKAMFRLGDKCDDSWHPGTLAAERSQGGIHSFVDAGAIWMNCAGDCCFANAFDDS